MASQEFIFDGPFLSKIDIQRLTCQQARVFVVMFDGRWRTISEVRKAIGSISEAGVSARIRDLRKERNGSHRVERRRRDADTGLWEYRMIPNPESDNAWILDKVA